MDPWLEWYWGDVHASLAMYTRNQLNEQLPPGLVARAQERVYVESPFGEPRSLVPDAHVVERQEQRSSSGSGGGAAVAAPRFIEIPEMDVTERYIEIWDAKNGDRVITSIEFVSDTNKAGGVGRRKYLQKQREVLASDVNLVEIDLLRGGKPVTAVWSKGVPAPERAPYHACIRRAMRSRVLEYYPFPLRQPLPRIAIPLRPDDIDVSLDLQALVDEAYRTGRYGETIDYTAPPHTPLNAVDAAWADELIQQWHKIPG